MITEGHTTSLFPFEASSPSAVSDAPDGTLAASIWSNDLHPPTVTVRTTVSGLPTGEVAGASIFSTPSMMDWSGANGLHATTAARRETTTISNQARFMIYLRGMNSIY